MALTPLIARIMQRTPSSRTAALIAGACIAAASLCPSSATAGPEEEEHSQVFLSYPGFLAVFEGRSQQIVARIEVKHYGGPRTVPLRICVLVNSLRRPRVNGHRSRVVVVNDGHTICWCERPLSSGQRIRAVVRADIPVYGQRHSFTETTEVSLNSIYSPDTPADTRDGTVRIKPRPR